MKLTFTRQSDHDTQNLAQLISLPGNLANTTCWFVAVVLLAVSAPAVAQVTWPQPQHDSSRSGRVEGEGAITEPVMMWRYFMGGDLDQSGVAFWDVAGDETSEVITLDGGRIVARQVDGAVVWDTPNYGATRFWGLYDIDADGTPELLFQGGFDLHIMDIADGSDLWQVRNQGEYMLVANVDMDDELEIVFRNDTSVRGLRVFDFSTGIENGTLKWESDDDRLPQHSFELVVGELHDGNTGPEIIIDNNQFGRLIILDASTGDVLRYRNTQLHNGQYSYGFAQVVNVDSDEQNEFVLTGCCSGASDDGSIQIAVYDYGSNSIQWHYEFGRNNSNMRLDVLHNGVTDLNNDEAIEIVVSVYNDTTELGGGQDGINAPDEWVTIVFDAADGSVLASLTGVHAEAIVDLDGDGTHELVVQETRSEDIRVPRFGTIRAYDFDGDNLTGAWSLPASSVLTERPAWEPSNADLRTQDLGSAHHMDDDGLLELLVVRDLEDEAGEAGQDSVGDVLQAINGESSTVSVAAQFEIPVGTELGFAHHGVGLLTGRHLALTGNDGTLRICDDDLTVHAEMQFGDFLNDPLVVRASGGNRMVVQDSRLNLQSVDIATATPIDAPTAEWTLPNLTRQNLFAYDRNGDGVHEIVRRNLTSAEVPMVQLLDEDGKALWEHQFTGSLGSPHGFVGGEFGSAGETDLADLGFMITYAGDDYRIETIDGFTGTRLASNSNLLGYYKNHNLLSLPDTNSLYVIHSDASEVLNGSTLARTRSITPSPHGRYGVAADFDGNGNYQVFPNALKVEKEVWSTATGGRDWSFTIGATGPWHGYAMRYPGLSVGLNNSDHLDLALAGPNGDLSLHDVGGGTGTPWIRCLEDGGSTAGEIDECAGTAMSDIATGDVDGDGVDEFVIGGKDGFLYVINSEDGTLLWSYEFGYIIGAPRLADVNYNPDAPDGVFEILVSVGDGYVYAIGQARLDTPTGLREVAMNRAGELVEPATDIDESEFRHQLGLAWDAVDGADGYRYAVYSEHGTLIVPFENAGSATSAVVSGLHLVLGETYSFQVQAYDASGSSSLIAESDGVIIVDVSSPTVDPITITPPVFNPSLGTTVTIESEVYDATGLASYELVIKADGESTVLVRRTVSLYGVASHPIEVVWDGRDDDSGTFQPTGDYVVTITATDLLDKTAEGSETAEIDADVPGLPILEGPTGSLTESKPTFHGSAEPGSTVLVEVNSEQTACSVLVEEDGSWECQSEVSLPDDDHTAAASAEDAAGNVSGWSETVHFTIDSQAPDPPVISQPADDSRIGTNRPTVVGTAEADAHVVVKIDDELWCETDADGDGDWSCVRPEAESRLTQGLHSVTATAEDAVEHVSNPSDAVEFTVDTEAPSKPVITQPTDGERIGSNRPTIAGTAESNSHVVVKVGSITWCETDADGDGEWSCVAAPETTLDEGPHSASARAEDEVGNVSNASDEVNFRVDTAAPSPPVIAQPGAGARLATDQPTIGGTAEANAHVVVKIDGDLWCEADANGDGNWSCGLPAPEQSLDEGPHSAVATAADSVGNVSDPSSAVNFTVDTLSPDPPVIGAPGADEWIATNQPTISGTAEALSHLVVKIDNVLWCETDASDDGSWSCAPTDPERTIAEYGHSTTAIAVDAVGNESDPSVAVDFTVDTQDPAPPVIEEPGDDSRISDDQPTIGGTAESGAHVVVTIDGDLWCEADADFDDTWSCVPESAETTLSDGPHSAVATAQDRVGNTSDPSVGISFTVDTLEPSPPAIEQPAANSQVDTDQPTVSGTAEANAHVVVKIGSVEWCEADADTDGSWSCAPTAPETTLGEGPHTATATAEDAVGNVSDPSAGVTFTVDTLKPSPPVIVQPGIDSRLATDQPSVAGTAEANAHVVVKIDEGAWCETDADSDGNWSCVPPAPETTLAEGAHSATATAQDALGHESDPSDSVPFTVDTLKPVPPVIEQPAAGSRIADNHPTVSGTAEASSHVVVQIDSEPWCEAQAGVDGFWTCAPVSPDTTLSDGPHTAVATAEDSAGHMSDPSDTLSFTIDTTAPSAPVCEQPTVDAHVNTNQPEVSGIAEANSHVVVEIDALAWCETDTDSEGNWSCVPIAPETILGDGTHTASASAEDDVGNLSPACDTVSFFVDTVSPSAPVLTEPVGDRSNPIDDNTPMFVGTTEADAQVTVFLEPDHLSLCSTEADEAGAFSCESETTLDEGEHSVVAVAWDAAGNESAPSDSVQFWIDTDGDSDEDGIPDLWEQENEMAPYDADAEADPDGDGLTNLEEYRAMGDPKDADTDDDGVVDGQERFADLDSDGDGLTNVRDPDSDDDGVPDGVELGVTEPHADTDTERGIFVADADDSTTTNPVLADSDEGGQDDGAEDWDHNGRVDPGESDPTDDGDDDSDDELFDDSDGDGLTDFEEIYRGVNPDDADSDDDGVHDGDESNWTLDMDRDDLIDVLDPDSDNDGLPDGLEVGLTETDAETDLDWERFWIDSDPAHVTSMVGWDTDGDGLSDGAEDFSYDGEVDDGESDPLDYFDRVDAIDSDQDGLSDEEESTIGTASDDGDSDDDGVLDGDEWNWWDDQDQDDTINVFDHDSDGDRVFDGTERGVAVAGDDTDTDEDHFIADDDVETTTKMLVADSDGDTLWDGEEDLNANGAVDGDDGESDPNDPTDPANICADSDECGECEECVERRCEPILECGGSVADPEPDVAEPDAMEAVEEVEVEEEQQADGCSSCSSVGESSSSGSGLLIVLCCCLVLFKRRKSFSEGGR